MNLGGFFFHIDEDAYQKLNRYFSAIRNSLSIEGRDEIMNDIESRIAELFSEKLGSSKQVLSLNDIDDVIDIMGQPEDYKIEEEPSKSSNYSYKGKTKKLYRDKETGIVAGVCSGLGHYFGLDPVWIRIALVLLVFAGFGVGLLAYIILWLVTPEAITTSEKLEMKGEPITISNIEKKVKEEFESVSDKFKSADYTQMGENVRSGAQKVGSSLGDIIVNIMKIFAKFIGAIMVFTGGITIIGLLVGVFTLSSTSFMKLPWIEYFESFNYTGTSLWIICLISFFAVAIPFFFLLILGLKILVPTINSIGNVAKLTLSAIWLSSIIALITLGIITSSELAYENKVVYKSYLNKAFRSNDTLTLKFKNNDYFSKDVDDRTDFELVQDSLGHEYIYSNNVELELMPTDETKPYIQIEYTAKGKTLSEARKNADRITYKFRNDDTNPDTLSLDNYFLIDPKYKFRDHQVRIFLFVPKGMYIKPDRSLKHYDITNSDYFGFYTSSNDYIYKVEENKIKCKNCPTTLLEDEDEESDDDNTTVILNEDGLQIKKDTTIKNTKDIKELKFSKEGIIIKTE
ncbi:PspC domain-containing protein [Flavobacterium columnare]|uniref:PspC domain-containing protein n=2 Tax=Flavobacterium columnare TaxID=996 RepID=A0AAI8CFD6_9FLAO|nr:PspC domain-containing protein [Flavobacterium columnare]QOG58500.1 PspC domain-containing protein [Flavobacterium columnare]QOG61223.1 PspC domain-containing protein [Flavobacterium columnare]QOG63945.1 PspC domain-containing protein [Flavobacterium columnare]QOG66669.1 PspC domain-containing protein [Flavobacterium columnare]